MCLVRKIQNSTLTYHLSHTKCIIHSSFILDKQEEKEHLLEQESQSGGHISRIIYRREEGKELTIKKTC